MRIRFDSMRGEINLGRKSHNEILNNLPLAVYLVAENFSIKYANRMFNDKFGRPNGRKCYQALSGKSEPCGKCPMEYVLKTGKTAMTGSVLPDDREYLFYTSPSRATAQKPTVTVILIDVTDHRRGEAAIRKRKYEIGLKKYSLTPQERKVANHILQGKNDKEIAEKLGISANTVKRHVQGVYRKIGINNRTKLMAIFHDG
ncbi:MAG: hypothetical protein IEMM0002_1519 [bacterium]|nr:MAG: hypothetical protein IEMM0002_1519 [bacterium]